jgi:hypothetical protein
MFLWLCLASLLAGELPRSLSANINSRWHLCKRATRRIFTP